MSYELLIGDCRQRLADLPTGSAQTCITSPPYFGLRDYGHDSQIGSEPTPDEFVSELVKVFHEVRRVLADDGTVWLNLGDSYAGSRAGAQGANGQMADRSVAAARCRVRGEDQNDGGVPAKNLLGIPWRVAFALQADGWYLRQDIIWHKPNPMPESVTDRCTKSHEYIFLLSKNPRYYFNSEAIQEPATNRYPGSKSPIKALPGEREGENHNLRGSLHLIEASDTRNRRDVWTVPSAPYAEAHFATYPPELILPCVLAGSKPGDTVLDPFNGAGTTGLVALENGRNYVGIELNPAYAALTRKRLARVQMDMFRSQPIAA